ncbi:MAG: hypothetical protein HYX61_12600 [Gammaproteobacteria bacterium]|jgi:uncharacterized membrane protein YhaH (DUF805 family)|nr:hypothetical protein [Gammaproteobacteria bacterium]
MAIELINKLLGMHTSKEHIFELIISMFSFNKKLSRLQYVSRALFLSLCVSIINLVLTSIFDISSGVHYLYEYINTNFITHPNHLSTLFSSKSFLPPVLFSLVYLLYSIASLSLDMQRLNHILNNKYIAAVVLFSLYLGMAICIYFNIAYFLIILVIKELALVFIPGQGSSFDLRQDKTASAKELNKDKPDLYI